MPDHLLDPQDVPPLLDRNGSFIRGQALETLGLNFDHQVTGYTGKWRQVIKQQKGLIKGTDHTLKYSSRYMAVNKKKWLKILKKILDHVPVGFN